MTNPTQAEKESALPADLPPLRLEWLSPAELADNPKNWKTHPDAQINSLTDVIAEVGWAGAALLNERTGRLLDGHARKKVALGQGAQTIPVLIGNWTLEQEKLILATFDPIAAMAEPDEGKLDALLREVQTSSGSLSEMLADLAEKHAVIPGLNGDTLSANGETEPEEIDAEEEAEDTLDLIFKAPYPWFGGKSRVAKLVWKRFGAIENFIEPFFGSGAVFLNRPQPFEGTETINDFDGLVCNFWRAVQAAPDEVAKWADWPVNECDLHSRHAWLVGKKDTLQAKLEGDPDSFDAKIAGWWCWGMACWIGREFCSGKGPWQVVETEDGSRQLVHLSGEGQGVNRTRVHLGNEGQGVNRTRVHLNRGRGVNRTRVHLGDEGRGVNRQLVHLSDEGQGVNRQLVHLSDEGQGVNRTRVDQGDEGKAGLGERGLLAWMQAFSQRLRRVRVCCGDWTRVCGGRSGDAINHFFAGGQSCGIFLDPPYSALAGRDAMIYTKEDLQVAHLVREWAVAHGDDPRLRIALCGYEGEGHEVLLEHGWQSVRWKAHGGMSTLGDAADTPGKLNKFRERLFFSPHCLKD